MTRSIEDNHYITRLQKAAHSLLDNFDNSERHEQMLQELAEAVDNKHSFRELRVGNLFMFMRDYFIKTSNSDAMYMNYSMVGDICRFDSDNNSRDLKLISQDEYCDYIRGCVNGTQKP